MRLGTSQNVMGALYKGFFGSAVISAIALWPITDHVIGMGTVMKMGDSAFTGSASAFTALSGTSS